jgi:hypothetical protein
MESNPKINPETWYPASKIINNGWLPWIKSAAQFRDVYLKTEEARALYKPIIKETPKKIFYKIRGQTLIDIINKANNKGLKQ